MSDHSLQHDQSKLQHHDADDDAYEAVVIEDSNSWKEEDADGHDQYSKVQLSDIKAGIVVPFANCVVLATPKKFEQGAQHFYSVVVQQSKYGVDAEQAEAAEEKDVVGCCNLDRKTKTTTSCYVHNDKKLHLGKG